MLEATTRPLTPEQLQSRLHGVLAFPATPYEPAGAVDLAATERQARWIADAGVAALVAPSGTGELFSLVPEEAVAIVAATVRGAGGRVPVIAGVGFGPRVAAELAAAAADDGASGLMALPPYYAQPDPAALRDYYRAIAEAAPLGLLVYARDGAQFTPDDVVLLADELPTFVGYKDGTGDVRRFQRIRHHVIERCGRERLAWIAGTGDDLAGPYFSAGAQAYTSSLACFWPEASVRLYELARDGDAAALEAFVTTHVQPFFELRARRKGFEVSVMKVAMELLGFVAGPARAPLANLEARDRADLAAVLAELPIPTAAERSRA